MTLQQVAARLFYFLAMLKLNVDIYTLLVFVTGT
jgi:hypothetical protein